MQEDFNLSGWSSIAIHGGHNPDPNYAHHVPIYASSSYVYDTAEQGMRRFTGEDKHFIYSRWGNPTLAEAERKIAALETFSLPLQVRGILHASGMAAITTLMLSNLKKGEKVLTHFSLYGGTEELINIVLPPLGIEAVVVDLRNPSKAQEALEKDKQIRLVYLETPANPTLQCIDIEAITQIAKSHNIPVACDNTFATPYLQQPFRFGVDFVVHSTTKFLNGHGNAIGGILLGKDLERMNRSILKTHRLLGGNSNSFDAFLLIQGIKTLQLRMDAHCANAQAVAEFLNQHPAVEKVNYTGLPSHPDHEIANRQMRNHGGVLSFELKKGMQGGIDFMNKLKMCVRTVSLGTCDTLLSHPASTTHYGVPKEQRELYGITDGLVRMNVGIETLTDIIADLDQALR